MHEIVIIIAKYFILISLALSLYVWLKLDTPQKKRYLLLAIVGGILTLILAKLGSKLYYDPRPFIEGHFTPYFAHGNDNGFPSDHTLFTSFLAVLALYFNRKIGIILFGIAGLVGISRVIAGVHHSLDIIGSIVFAICGFYIALWIVNKVTKPKGRVRNAPKLNTTSSGE
jgi:undecaprenyl-diphosphatase